MMCSLLTRSPTLVAMVRASVMVSLLLGLTAAASALEDPNIALSKIIKDLRAAPDGDAGKDANNKACDTLLAHINNQIIKEKLAVVSLPNVNQEFDQSVAGLQLKGSFTASNGRIGSLASLSRISDATVKKSDGGNKIEVSLGVTLKSFSIQFQKYTSNINGMKHEGKIDVFAKKYSAALTISVTVQGKGCNIKIEKLKVQELDGISIVIVPTNPTLLSYMNYLVETEKTKRIEQLEKALIEQGENVIKGFKCQLTL